MIQLKMGEVKDYFRPGPGMSWCDMFMSTTGRYDFSPDGAKWVTMSSQPYP